MECRKRRFANKQTAERSLRKLQEDIEAGQRPKDNALRTGAPYTRPWRHTSVTVRSAEEISRVADGGT